MPENILRGSVLHKVSQIHNANRIGNMLHHAQIVGNKQVSQLILLLQIFQKIDDLRLNAHVERGDRLVADDETGRNNERSCNTDSLALPGGECLGSGQ